MSTRSTIIVQRSDGSWAAIYCHFDGYLEGVGQTLNDHYQEQAKCEELVDLGDISSLGAGIGVKHGFDDRDADVCTAYGRDRGEAGCEAHTGATLADVWPGKESWVEYAYVFAPEPGGSNEPRWHVGDPDKGPESLVLLSSALANPGAGPQPDIKAPWGVIGHRDPARA